MKRSLVFTLFYICTPLLVIARTVQRFYMIDSQTGFYRTGFETAGAVISGVCVAFAVMLVIMTRLSRPEKVALPQKSRSLSGASCFAAVCLAISAAENFVIADSGFADALEALCAVAFALVLAWFGFAQSGRAEFAPTASLVGVLYAMVRLFVSFIGYNGEIAISDSMFDIVTMCLVLLFFTALAKLVCGIGDEKLPRSLYGFGLAAVMFCLCAFIPCVVALLTGNSATIHGGALPDAAHIGFAALIFAVLCSFEPTPAGKADEAHDEADAADSDVDGEAPDETDAADSDVDGEVHDSRNDSATSGSSDAE